jgi:VanZ family protein
MGVVSGLRSRVGARTARVAPVAVWSVAVVVASVVDPPSAASGPTPTLLGVALDKWVHLGTYGATAVLAGVALRAREARRLSLVVLYAVALGTTLELVQWTLPLRSFEVVDAVANGFGALLGTAAYRLDVARRGR